MNTTTGLRLASSRPGDDYFYANCIRVMFGNIQQSSKQNHAED